jgi:hypothetical protein
MILGFGVVVGAILPYTSYRKPSKDLVFDVMTAPISIFFLSILGIITIIWMYSNMTGKPKIIAKTLGGILITEALLVAGAMSLGWLFLRRDGYYDNRVDEDTFVAVLIIANYIFIPIAASKLAWDITDSRKSALITGILTLAIAGLLMPVVFDTV